MTYRFATPGDAAGILDIYAPYIRETVATYEYEVPSLADFTRRVAEISGKYPYLVCEEKGRILGYAYAASYRSRAAFQWDTEVSVYLAPEGMGRGIAKGLYQRLLPMLEELGYRTAYASIVPPNPQSVGLHRAFGFREIAVFTHTGYKFGRWLDLLWMEKRLGDWTKPPQEPQSVGELQKGKEL